ncbi:hypothetical protein V6N13_143586 [Hibiscus sabdariffa]
MKRQHFPQLQISYGQASQQQREEAPLALAIFEYYFRRGKPGGATLCLPMCTLKPGTVLHLLVCLTDFVNKTFTSSRDDFSGFGNK